MRDWGLAFVMSFTMIVFVISILISAWIFFGVWFFQIVLIRALWFREWVKARKKGYKPLPWNFEISMEEALNRAAEEERTKRLET